ncbi:MAG: AraC family transcriptional regulator [Oleispira sp.]|nr:AraC family transcriptional regulator [Oleispira sp.]MBL4881991.1 AraC family transcriptional regulator [Oleispira sp.]
MNKINAQPKVWFRLGMLIINGCAIDAEDHSHNAIQLIWPNSKSELKLDTMKFSQPIVVAAGQTHSLSMELGWIVLIEPQSFLGEKVNESLAGSPYLVLTDLENASITNIEQSANVDLVIQGLQPLWQVLNLIPADVISESQATPLDHGLDSRIQHLKNTLDRCFIDECLKPEHWKAQDIAKQLNLSESRFLHLFKQEMHITWRAYLLWRRLLCAVTILMKGRSATEAAHVAGFSDSAHLSRTFKKMFGLSIRQATQTLLK